MPVQHPLINIATRAALAAGKHIVRSQERLSQAHVGTAKKGPHDFVSDIDKQAESTIIHTIKQAYPDHGILSEEAGRIPGKDQYEWVIDPLDGTSNYLHGFQNFAVSIAVLNRGQPEHAVIYDPLRQELFTASKGAGAQLNDHRIRASQTNKLENALVGTGFPFKHREVLPDYLKSFESVLTQAHDIRRTGSAALDLAYIAAGRLDAFWEIGLNIWDIAAGILIIQESGATVTDTSGGRDMLKTGNIVAGNVKLHRDVLNLVSPHLKEIKLENASAELIEEITPFSDPLGPNRSNTKDFKKRSPRSGDNRGTGEHRGRDSFKQHGRPRRDDDNDRSRGRDSFKQHGRPRRDDDNERSRGRDSFKQHGRPRRDDDNERSNRRGGFQGRPNNKKFEDRNKKFDDRRSGNGPRRSDNFKRDNKPKS